MKFMKAEANHQDGRLCCTVSPLSCRQYTSKCPKSLRPESLLFATQKVKAEAPFPPISAQIFPWNFCSTGWSSYKAGFHSNPACLSSQKCYSPFKNAQNFLSSCRVSEDPFLPLHTCVSVPPSSSSTGGGDSLRSVSTISGQTRWWLVVLVPL